MKRSKWKYPKMTLPDSPRDIYMWRNYPKSIDEFFATIKTLQVFDHKILDEMMGETRNPIMIDNINNSIIHVYKPFCVGEQYISAIDTAHGVGKDYSGVCNFECSYR